MCFYRPTVHRRYPIIRQVLKSPRTECRRCRCPPLLNHTRNISKSNGDSAHSSRLDNDRKTNNNKSEWKRATVYDITHTVIVPYLAVDFKQRRARSASLSVERKQNTNKLKKSPTFGSILEKIYYDATIISIRIWYTDSHKRFTLEKTTKVISKVIVYKSWFRGYVRFIRFVGARKSITEIKTIKHVEKGYQKDYC